MSWKRQKDKDEVPVSFGYCEFETLEGVLRAMRLMNGMFVYGKNLEVKCPEKTQNFIRDYFELKKKEIIADGKLEV